MVYAHHCAHFVHTVAAGIHDDIGVDCAFVGLDGPGVIGLLGQGGNVGLPVNFGSGLAGVKGQGLTQLRRVDIAVLAIPKTAQQVIGGNERVTACAFLGVDDLVGDAHTARHGGEMPIALHLRLGIGQPDATIAVVIAHRIFWIVAQFLVERDGMALEAHHGLVRAKVGYLGGGMPCRARGQLVALDQDDVAPAFLGEMIECRTSGDTAADDNYFSSRFHETPPKLLCEVRRASPPSRNIQFRVVKISKYTCDVMILGKRSALSCSSELKMPATPLRTQVTSVKLSSNHGLL